MVRRGREDQWSVGDGRSRGKSAARQATTCRLLSATILSSRCYFTSWLRQRQMALLADNCCLALQGILGQEFLGVQPAWYLHGQKEYW